MLKLKFKNEPYWLDLGMGVRVKVKPCTSSVFYEAKAYMNSKVADMAKRIKDVRENGAKDENLPDLEDITKREAFADQQLILGLALAGIIEWDGILYVIEVKSGKKFEAWGTLAGTGKKYGIVPDRLLLVDSYLSDVKARRIESFCRYYVSSLEKESLKEKVTRMISNDL